ncbi:hypothetical protein RFI_16935 [Reticulomyxa filosa]|uniref:Uncharacterized protein n=1 Tax=Reticulomyxa filosa TaxID=46433 RepID=X6N1X8_RETFI|nr:hypothetical protein RFI_16935 [Reticulomyxa filosa]|eukprot:ETO20280.1 hypothetical protein RFI_16935 [Reticulomyxa filosa]
MKMQEMLVKCNLTIVDWIEINNHYINDSTNFFYCPTLYVKKRDYPTCLFVTIEFFYARFFLTWFFTFFCKNGHNHAIFCIRRFVQQIKFNNVKTNRHSLQFIGMNIFFQPTFCPLLKKIEPRARHQEKSPNICKMQNHTHPTFVYTKKWEWHKKKKKPKPNKKKMKRTRQQEKKAYCNKVPKQKIRNK